MGIEIERKFLVRGDGWRLLAVANPANTQLLRQGYLSSDPARVVRVRSVDAKAFLTIKGQNDGIVRAEWEYPIPLFDAEAMLAICQRPLIEKYRSRIMFGGFCWEVDEFLGENAGLIVAEIELPSIDQVFPLPDWIGEEVSADQRYKNSNLGRHPYSKWGQE